MTVLNEIFIQVVGTVVVDEDINGHKKVKKCMSIMGLNYNENTWVDVKIFVSGMVMMIKAKEIKVKKWLKLSMKFQITAWSCWLLKLWAWY